MQQYRFSWRKFLTFVFVIVALIAGAVWFFNRDNGVNPVQPTQPFEQGFNPTSAPNQPNLPAPTVVPGQNPAVVPPVPAGAQQYPALCQEGDVRTPLTVALDSYAGFYPVIYRVAAMPGSDYYCIDLMPKWSGPNYDRFGYSESLMEDKVRSGEVDIYFASNGALALWDANSGIVVWSTDQSAGADSIVARKSVASHFDPVTGEPLPNFNDALGRTVLVSKGSADHYFILKALQATGFVQGDVNIQFSDSPVKDFNDGVGEFVAYWDPVILDAMTPETKLIISTKDWRTISDYVVVSRQADAGKEEALAYFLADFNTATEYFTEENLPNTANVLVNFTFNNEPMADWMWLDTSRPYESLKALTDNVAFATLNDNVNMFERDFTGWSLVKDQFDKTHATWQYGGVYDNSDGAKGSLYDADRFISNKYVEILKKGGAKSVSGVFANDYVTDINQELPDVDEGSLFTLPELLTLKYKNIQFVEGQARQLIPGEMEKLLTLVQPIANLMSESPDAVIVLQGGHGYYSADPAVMEQQRKFAFRRALYIRDILSDKLGIPIARIVIDPTVIAPDHPLTDAELPNYVVVLIKVINTGGLK